MGTLVACVVYFVDVITVADNLIVTYFFAYTQIAGIIARILCIAGFDSFPFYAGERISDLIQDSWIMLLIFFSRNE